MRMPSSWLHRSCDSLARSVFLRAGFCQPFSSVFLGVFLLYERFFSVLGDFAKFFLCFLFLSVSSKVWSTCLALRWTASRLRWTRTVPRSPRAVNPPPRPHQSPLLRPPLLPRPLRSPSQRRLCLRPFAKLFSSRSLRCWRLFGKTERQIIPTVRPTIDLFTDTATILN